MDWFEVSEVCFGLVLKEFIPWQSTPPEDYSYEFQEAMEVIHKRKDLDRPSILRVIAPSYIQGAETQAASVKSAGSKEDYPALLREMRYSFELGEFLSKAGANLQKGKDVDLLPVAGKLQSAIAHESMGLTLGSDIDCSNYKPFIPSGYLPFDTVLGGIPADGPIVVYGVTSVGKSHFAANMMSRFLHKHENKKGAIYTLEMSAEHWKWRETKMYHHMEDVMDRLYISGSVRNIEELVAEIAIREVDIVAIDDVDGLVKENSAAEFERVYKKIKEICRFMKIPTIVLAQPNRMAKLSERFLHRYDIAWSGAAEDSAALLVALQRCSELDMNDDTFQLFASEMQYIICWKSRDGWPGDYSPEGQIGPGAIILSNNGNKSLWEGKPYKNRLWKPDERVQRMDSTNKKKRRRPNTDENL